MLQELKARVALEALMEENEYYSARTRQAIILRLMEEEDALLKVGEGVVVALLPCSASYLLR